MPNPGLPLEQMQEAVNAVELHGGPHRAAMALGINSSTLRNRYLKGIAAGLKPTARREYKQVHKAEKLGRVHMVIPDIQSKPGVPNDHLRWIAAYALEKRPDVIVQIGDWADMHSLSLYDKGKRCYEGRRYTRDIEAANDSLALFEGVIEDHNRANPQDPYNPRKVITFGNHEFRIIRATQLDPAMDGKLTLEDLDFGRRGWECYPFLEVVNIDGIEYSHYFISGNMGRPVSSAAALLKIRNCSATMGHTQFFDMAVHRQTQHIGLLAGIAYLHDEDYLGPQGNSTRRQIVMKHEVENGRYDPMFVSLRFLQKRYS